MESDESEEEQDMFQFQEKYVLLLERCESLNRENRILVGKIQHIRNLLIRCRMLKGFIIKKLDNYKDDWRDAICSFDANQNKDANESVANKADAKSSVDSKKVKTKKIKRKKRSAKDPLAPKKPANPFLQYCLEKRATVVGEMISSGTAEPSKQDITKQLASNWKTLSNKNKMVYYDKYKRSREKYAVDMHKYKTKNITNTVATCSVNTVATVSTCSSNTANATVSTCTNATTTTCTVATTIDTATTTIDSTATTIITTTTTNSTIT